MSLYSLLFRATLAVIRSAGNYATFTSPNPTPTADERGRYHPAGADGRRKDRWDVMILQAAAFLEISFHAINGIELLAILLAIAEFPPQLSHFAPQITHPELSVTAIVGSLLMGVGGALRIASYRAMGRHFTFQLAIKKDHTLITHGPYSVVRHPGYTGAYITLLGMVLSLVGVGGVLDSLELWRSTWMTVWGVALALAGLYISGGMIRRMKMEDMALRKEFKEKWVAWSDEVRYKLVPLIY